MITHSEFYHLQGKRIKTRQGEYVVLSARFGRKWYTIQMTADNGQIYNLRTRDLGIITIVENKKSDKKVHKESSEKVQQWQSKKYEHQSEWMDRVIEKDIKPGDTAMVRTTSGTKAFTIDKITANGIVTHWPNGRTALVKSHQIADLKKEEVKKQVVRRARRRQRRPMSLADILGGM